MIRLNPPTSLLIGAAGTGKTSSAVSCLEAGLHLRIVATEPSAPNRIIEEIHRRKLDPKLIDRLDWHFVSPAPTSWDALKDSARVVNTMSLEDIAKMRTGIAKGKADQWLNLLNAFANFTSDKTGEVLGDSTEWSDDCVLMLDSLTGVNIMSRNLSVGLKPNPSPGEWGVMQGNIYTLLNKLASDCKCFFVCIAHIEREMDQITGLNNVTVSTLGAKLAPKLPPLFTNVILAQRDKATFTWSTAASGVDTKSGDLPIADGLPPSFEPIINSYRARRKAAIGGKVVPLTPTAKG